MRLWLIIIPLALSACAGQRAYNKAVRNLSRLQAVLQKHPELADTLQLVVKDTVRISPLQSDIVVDRVVDSAMVDALARELCDRLRAAERPAIDTATDPPGEQIFTARKRLIKAACPPMKLDTMLMIRVYNKTFDREVPMGLSIETVAGRLMVTTMVKAVNIPDEKFKTVVQISRIPFYSDVWFYVSLGLAALLVIVFVSAVRRR